MSETLVGLYLFERLKQLGVKTVFGVPGGMRFLRRTILVETQFREMEVADSTLWQIMS
jgi:TPP-dependent 2-oxoacid decarboxylase